MKILIIRNYPSFMDVVKNTYNIQEMGLAKALVRRGNTCDILFWTNKEEMEIEIPVDNCGKVHVFYKHGKTALKNTVYTKCEELFSKYDILQTAEYNQIQSWICVRKYPQKAIIYHGPYYSTFNKRYNLMCIIFDMFFLRRYLKLNTKFIVKSNMAKKFLEKKGVNMCNVSTIGVGIDTQMLSSKGIVCKEPLYKKMQNDINVKLLYVGRFEERRNIPFILEVFNAILKERNDVTLYMIGTGDKKYLEKTWNEVNQLGIQEHIVYQERIEQKYLSKIYKLADFFLLPTEYEIFGMVLLEAMYYENVVITTENGGSSTLIKNSINGYIKDTKSIDAWARLILDIIHDSEKMQSVKQSAKNTIATEFTWDSLAPKFEEVYKLVIREENE